MTTTPTTNQEVADSIVEMLGTLARPSTGPEPVESLSVYFSANAKNRKGGWIANVRRGCLVKHVEIREATDQASAEAAAALLFTVQS